MEYKQTHIPYGLVTGLAMIVIGVILQVTNMNFAPGIKWLGIVPFIIGIILNGIAFSKANDANVTFGKVYGSCFKATAIIAIVMFVWSLASLFIFPNMKDQMIEMTRAEMAKNPGMSEEIIEKSISITRKFYTSFLLGGALFGSLLYGAIFSLIGAAVAKKKPQPVFPN